MSTSCETRGSPSSTTSSLETEYKSLDGIVENGENYNISKEKEKFGAGW